MRFNSLQFYVLNVCTRDEIPPRAIRAASLSPPFFLISHATITIVPSPYVLKLVVRSHRLRVLKNHSVEPPFLTNTPGCGIQVSFQYALAYPGQLAAFRPCSLMYQFEHPASKTDPFNWRWMSLTHWFSEVALISIMEAFWSISGFRRVRAT